MALTMWFLALVLVMGHLCSSSCVVLLLLFSMGEIINYLLKKKKGEEVDV